MAGSTDSEVRRHSERVHATYFPILHRPMKKGVSSAQASRSQAFLDHGSLAALDVMEKDNETHIVCQKWFTKDKHRLQAQHPTLPTLREPAPGLLGPFYSAQKRLKEQETLIKLAKSFRSKVTAEPGFASNVRELLSSAETDITDKVFLEKSIEMPQQIRTLCEKACQIWACPSKVCVEYTGGSLTHERVDTAREDGMIYYCSNAEQPLLCSLPYNYRNGDFVVQDSNQHVLPFQENIMQLCSSSFTSQVMLGVRVVGGFWTVTHTPETDLFQVESVNVEGSPSGLAVSPYLEHDYAFTTTEGSIYHSYKGKMTEIYSNLQPRFACMESWRDCHFGAHPRQLIVSDRSGVALCDFRTSTYKDSDLFALPHKMLGVGERIHVSKPDNQDRLYHWAASDESLFLTDQRMPNHPVLHWKLLVRTPPQFLDISTVKCGDDLEQCVILGTQCPAEVMCFPAEIHGTLPPHATESPWMVSKPTDAVKVISCGSHLSQSVVCETRLGAPLAGMGGIVSKDKAALTVIQLSLQGDLFHQTYKSRECRGDKTQACGPGSQPCNIEPSAARHFKRWTKKAATVMQQESVKLTDVGKVDASQSFGSISQLPPAHVLCALCMPIVIDDVNEDTIEKSSECMMCGNTLAQSYAIARASKHDRIPREMSRPVVSFMEHIDPSSHKDTRSQLLLKQWYGETNLKDLLLQRDEEVKKYKQSLFDSVHEANASQRPPSPVSSLKDDERSLSSLLSETEPDSKSFVFVPPISATSPSSPMHGPFRVPESQSQSSSIPEIQSQLSSVPDSQSQMSCVPETQSLHVEHHSSDLDSLSEGVIQQTPSRKRKRHDSGESCASLLSNSSLIGFMATPPRLKTSPVRKKRYSPDLDKLFKPVNTHEKKGSNLNNLFKSIASK